MHRLKSESEYYLQVVEEDEKPQWPETEEELVVGNQLLDGGFTQYWAYPRSSKEDPEDLPKAEELAQKNPTSIPAVLVDERPSTHSPVVLILTKDGHAWAKTESDVDNLEENINSIVDFAKQKFGFKVEHFMTTSRVSKEVEKKLDSVEDAGPSEEEKETVEVKSEETKPMVAESGKIEKESADSNYQFPTSGVYMQESESSNKLTFILIILVLLALIGGAVYFRQKIFNKLGLSGIGSTQTEITPTPTEAVTPTNTPTPTPPRVDRSTFKVKVLNGTSTSGQAASLSDKLKSKGWNVTSVGNASTSDYTQTEVHTKADEADAGKLMVSDLSSDYQASASADLTKSSNVDVEVIIGKQ